MKHIKTKLADWYRKIELEPDHSWLPNRFEAIDAFSQEVTAGKILNLARIFHDSSGRDDSFEKTLRETFLESDSAFRICDNAAEIRMLAGAILVSLFEHKDVKTSSAALIAVCLRPIGREKNQNPTPEIIEIGRLELRAKRAEIRRNIFSPLKRSGASTIDPLLSKVAASCEQGNITEIYAPIAATFKAMVENQTKTNRAINSLLSSHDLYREDSQILWWLTGKWSMDLDTPFEALEGGAVALVVAKELADLTLNYPGPYSSSAVIHNILAYSGCDLKSGLQLSSYINSTDKNWRMKVSEQLGEMSGLGLCPVITGISKSIEVKRKTDWYPAFKNLVTIDPKLNIPPSLFAEQAYNEFLFSKILGEMAS